MTNRADERSRTLGGVVCLAVLLGGALFLYGLAVQSYWALAIPLGALVLFVLCLVFWIGWTILTVQVAAEGTPLDPGGGPGSATTPEAAAEEGASAPSPPPGTGSD